MEREVGGGIGMGSTCKPMAVSFQCMIKSTTNKKKNKKMKKKLVKVDKLQDYVYKTFSDNLKLGRSVHTRPPAL